MPYKNIQHTMEWLRAQIIDSYDFAYYNCPEFDNPEEMFNWFKLRTTYQKDPPGIELLQSMETLMTYNRKGKEGHGDCDCYTITLLACMAANGWGGKQIILAGNKKHAPQHIYAGINWKGRDVVLDLTNRLYDYERPYKYKQVLHV